MSYEFCLMDSTVAPSREAANAAWDEETYRQSSLPDFDKTARKWVIKDGLLKFNSQLQFMEPGGKPGFFDKLTADDPPPNYLLLTGWAGEDADKHATNYHLYDSAIEVSLPWNPERSQVEAIVREVWRHLETLTRMGFGTVYDTERDVLLNFETDFDAVVKRYIANVDYDGEGEPPGAGNATQSPAELQASQSGTTTEPFSGNVPQGKPWWKVW